MNIFEYFILVAFFEDLRLFDEAFAEASSCNFGLLLAVDLSRLHDDIQLALLIDQKGILLLLFWFINLSGVVQR